jgi:hypothetical protein
MEDNQYFVRLDPIAFQAMFSEIAAAIEWETDADERHKAGLQKAMKALQQADSEHICIDEVVR